MTIIEALKTHVDDLDIRITYNHRWMFYTSDGFMVMERKPYAKNSKCLISQATEEEAVQELLKKEE
jgi:hypothetical protein